MAKSYYFDYISMPDIYKNSTVEARGVGGAFAFCVYDTLDEYGLRMMERQPLEYDPVYVGDARLKAFIAYYDKSGFLCPKDKTIDISLTSDNKLLVEFKVDPLLPENSNDEIISDIKEKAVNKKIINENAETHIAEEQSGSNKGGCYVATAVYGSYDCPEVWILRRFRDSILAESWYGRAFINFYYAVSPTLVRWFGKTTWFQRFWKSILDMMVKQLREQGYKDSHYQDKNWR